MRPGHRGAAEAFRHDRRRAHHPIMLNIDLTGRRALVAGVADDGGYGFAIAKALAEAGATVSVATWPPALTIFRNLLDRGKMDDSRRMPDGAMLTFEQIYPFDAGYDTLADAPEDVRTNKRYKDVIVSPLDAISRTVASMARAALKTRAPSMCTRIPDRCASRDTSSNCSSDQATPPLRLTSRAT